MNTSYLLGIFSIVCYSCSLVYLGWVLRQRHESIKGCEEILEDLAEKVKGE